MRGYSDRTAERAIGKAAKEWRYMAGIAVKLRTKNCDPVWAEQQEKMFTGVYKRLLTDPLDEVIKEAGR